MVAIIIIARQLLEQKLKMLTPEGALQPSLAEGGQTAVTEDQPVLVPEPASAKSFVRTQADIPVEPKKRSFLR
jgi:hypothetical protein